MSDWNLPWDGSCRCGQVQFRVSAPPLITMACHCTGCQKMTAAPYSLSVAIPTEGFAVTQGEPVIGGLHGTSRHYFCPHCMSWLFTRPEGLDFFVNVRQTMLEKAAGLKPFVETYTAEKLPWVTTPAVHSYETLPEVDSYPSLLQEFATQAQRS